MSTAAQPAKAATSAPPQEVTVISHSQLFYWWPVWVVAYLMALLTYIDRTLMVTVPPGSRAVVKTLVPTPGDDQKTETREAIVLPENRHLAREISGDLSSNPVEPRLHMTHRKAYGVIFCVTLLLVIVITNVPLRGMWSVIVILVIVMMSIIFALAGWWEKIFSTIALLDIRINMGGYLFIATSLLIAWFIVVMFFDKQIYMVFQPGQFKVCTEIGGGEKVYDTIGLTLERQRSDLFRHLILGLGSGDLIVKTTGAQSHHFDLPNVLFISRKVQMIENLLRQRIVDTQKL